jgi:AraC-like DNA-binding protein
VKSEALRDDSQESVLSVGIVRGLIEAVEQVGVPREELLRVAPLDPTLLSQELAYVPRGLVFRLCERALDLTYDPALGLHWGQRMRGVTFHPVVSNLVAHSADLREAFASLRRFHPLFSKQPSFSLSESGDKVAVQCFEQVGASSRVRRFVAEMFVLGIVRLIRSFSPHAWVDSVSFAFARPDYHDEYTHLLGVAPRFEQPDTGIVFDRELMNSLALHRDEDFRAALRAIAERRVTLVMQRASFAARVRDLIVQNASTKQPDMTGVARALGLSRRSLGRRLEAEGSSYNAAVKEARAIAAKRYLRERRLTIQETAYEMGFSDSSAFYRAFKRWTGKTPSAYRAVDFERES